MLHCWNVINLKSSYVSLLYGWSPAFGPSVACVYNISNEKSLTIKDIGINFPIYKTLISIAPAHTCKGIFSYLGGDVNQWVWCSKDKNTPHLIKGEGSVKNWFIYKGRKSSREFRTSRTNLLRVNFNSSLSSLVFAWTFFSLVWKMIRFPAICLFVFSLFSSSSHGSVLPQGRV
jgi:hypothetical protein